MQSTTLDLTISIGTPITEGYPATIRGPGGDGRGILCLPSEQPAIREQLTRLKRLDTDQELLTSVGHSLFVSLFTGELGAVYARSRAMLEQGQRMRIVLDIHAEQAAVAALPWEFLCDPDSGPLALLGTPIVRYLPQPAPIPVLKVEPPLRMLLTAAQTPPAIDVAREFNAIQAELAKLGDLVDITVVPNLSRARLQDVLREGYHIWHHLGHGGFDRRGNGRLLLEDANGEADAVTASGLNVLLAGSGIRLVVLNACLGADVGAEPMRSLAPALIQAQIPAVIAMQFALPEETARVFASEFYQSLADGFAIDHCLAEGRRAVAGVVGYASADWGIPVLYSRAIDGRLFDLPPLPKPACPYPGMVPFSAQDARFFHGREQEIADMLSRLRLQQRLLVIGPSGSGKSSLVRAGLLPQLASSTLFANMCWHVEEFRPGARPADRLHEALLRMPDTQLNTARGLLFIDQFEEVFTSAEAEERNRFFAELQAALATKRATLIIAMRADFYPDLMSSPLWPLDPAERIEIAPLRGEPLRIALEQPAQAVGVRMERGLIDQLLNDAADEPGVLPLIQETMVLLWDRMPFRMLPLSSYQALGQAGRSGLAVAIATRADATLAQLNAEQKLVARRILLRLVQFGEGRSNTRRQQPLSELRAAGEAPELFETTLQVLTDSRILTITSEVGRETVQSKLVDIVHESLIRGWPVLQEWINARREAEQVRRRLEEKAAEWVRLGRTEDGGLLDAYELPEANRWLEGSSAIELGYSDDLREFILVSNAELERAAHEREIAHQRELAQAQALLQEQAARAESERVRAEEQAQSARALTRRAKQLRIGLIAALALLFLSAGLGVLSNQLAREAEAQRQSAVESAAQAKQSAKIQYGLTLLADAKAAIARGDTDAALVFATEASNLPIDIRPADAEALLSDAAYSPGTARVLSGHTSRVWSIAVDRAGTTAYSGSEDRSIRIWDLATAQELGALEGHTDTILALVLAPDQHTLISASEDHSIRLWDTLNRKQIGELNGHDAAVNALAVTPDGQRLVSASADHTLRVWDLVTRQTLLVLRGHEKEVWGVAVSPNGGQALSASEDGTIRQWDLTSGTELRRYNANVGAVYAVSYSPDGRFFASAGLDHELRVWEIGVDQPQQHLAGHTDLLLSVSFSPDGRTLLTTSADASLRLWDVASWREVRRFVGHAGQVTSAIFTPNGSQILSCSGDNTLRLWEIDPGAQRQKFDLKTQLPGVTMLSGSNTLLAAAQDGNIYQLDRTSGREVQRLHGHTDQVYQVALSLDGNLAVSSSRDNTLRVWDVPSGRELRVLQGHTNRIPAVALSPNRWIAVSGSFDRSVRVWDLIRGTEVYSFTGHTRAVQSVAISPDGSLVVSGSRDKSIRLWDLNTHTALRELDGHTGEVNAVVFSHDGRHIASASADGTARIWDVQTGVELHRFTGHTGPVLAVALSPDGHMLATASADTTVRIWDVASEREIRRLRGHTEAVSAVIFLTDGHGVISSSADGTIREWRIDTLPELVAWTTQHRYMRESEDSASRRIGRT